jgi:hypothetical protein
MSDEARPLRWVAMLRSCGRFHALEPAKYVAFDDTGQTKGRAKKQAHRQAGHDRQCPAPKHLVVALYRAKGILS